MHATSLPNPALREERRSESTHALSPAEFNQFLVELTGLLENASTPEEFFTPYLERVMEITGATGVAVWQRQPAGQLLLVKEFNFGALNLDGTPNGMACHYLLLEEAALSRRGHWVAPAVPQDNAAMIKSNLSPLALVFAPALVEDKVVGLLEVFFPPDQEGRAKRSLTRLTTELAAFTGAFWHKRQYRQLQIQQQLSQQVEVFAAKLHQSLDPREVAYISANDGKRLVECDQLSVGRRRGVTCEVLAMSGAVNVERRSPLVQAMERLLDSVADWGEPLTYDGRRDESLPPRVVQTLDAYLALSKCRLLIALPLADQRLEGPNKIVGLLVAESFDAAEKASQMRQRLDCLTRHIGPALSNALTLDRLPLKWLTRPLANLQAGLHTSSKIRVFTFVILLLVFSAFLSFFPLPLKPEATGQLVPLDRRIVYSSLNGKILQLAVKHGDHVEKGQELLFIEDLDTQLKVDQLSVKISSMAQNLAHLEEQLSKPLSSKERADYLNDRIRAQYDLGKAKVERNLLLSENRTPRKAPMPAPLAGQILTFDAKEKLLGKTVKTGDPLLRLAAIDGPWEVELYIPERDASLLREALYGTSKGELAVDLLVTNDPHRVYSGTLDRSSLGGEMVTHNEKVVLPAHVTITDQVLLQQLKRMPVGVEVRARIHCGHAPASYVWFNEIWTFLYEKFIF